MFLVSNFISALAVIALDWIFWIVPFLCFTLLLYKYKPQYVNLALHIGVWGLLYVYFLNFNPLHNGSKALWIIFIQEVPHLAFTLYTIIYAYKSNTQKIPFTKRLGKYIASFFIGIGLFIASFLLTDLIVGFLILLQDSKRTLISLVLYISFISLFVILILLLLSHILYKNHKPFFTKILYRILSMIGKDKP
ncbi:TPA: hypothetical protein SHD56_001723 [Campylobacter coli]|nr:hypothetical protein [Campylobacter coli]HEH5497311.1 hypothetical protein [Campylobacter coli]